jgi:shikimate 5-dehydrogenase
MSKEKALKLINEYLAKQEPQKVELSKVDDVEKLLNEAKNKFKKADTLKYELRSLISDAMIRADFNVKGQATKLIQQAKELGADDIVKKLEAMVSEGQKLTNEYKSLYNFLK